MRFFATAPEPLSADFVWDFFTRKKPKWWPAFIDGYPLRFQRRRIIARALNSSHASGIGYHYDVSNEFYRLFLDRDFMFYSCADFASPDDTIETAQRRKADHLLKLIAPAAGERILELGCGWGSMLRHIASATRDEASLSGMTLSQEQVNFIRQSFGFDVVLEDFVTAEYPVQTYDKIYSIGAMEHVRPDEILPLLRKLHSALVPGGRLVQQFFSLNGDPLPTSMVSGQLFFPGSVLSTHKHHLWAAREAGFELTHDSCHDYRPTGRAWFDRLVENRARALELVGPQTYNRYLILFAAGWIFFDQNEATVHRLVLQKR
jgi:cyclopropane-fatty-acyl-phospholipid synthase